MKITVTCLKQQHGSVLEKTWYKYIPQIFLYMSTTCCESFKSFGEVGKKFFY